VRPQGLQIWSHGQLRIGGVQVPVKAEQRSQFVWPDGTELEARVHRY
jgi:hypothetical protein